jgi:hypothetical protein
MNRLIKIFETRFAGVICFLFAIANRIIFTTLNSLIGSDTKVQLTYTKNLLAGKGIGVTKYFTSDLNSPVFDTQQMFPPGFSLTIIPFLKLFGDDEFKAVLAYDIVAAILFVIVIRLLGKKAGLPPALNNIVTLMAGCVQYLFFMSWSSTDAISLCFVLFGVAVTIDIINKKESIGLLRTLGLGILFCLPFFFRFMYLPIAILFPFAILLFAFSLKDKRLKIIGSKLLISSAFFLAIITVFNLIMAGNALFVHDYGRGIFFNQLTKWYPFLPASFINLDFAAQLPEKVSSLSYSRVMFFFEIINPVLLVLFLILLWRYLAIHKKDTALSPHFLFIVIGSIISLSILLLLAYLTLTYKALPWGLIRWTHSQHARYFAFIYAFMPLLLFVCLYHYSSLLKKSFIKIFVFIALCCLAIEMLHGVYYNIKIVLKHKDLALIRDADNGYRNFTAILNEIKKRNSGGEVIVSSPDQYYLHAASQLGYKAIFDYENLSRTDLKVTVKTILLTPVHQQEAIIFKDYIEKKKPQLFSTIAGTYFYTEEINP